MKKSLIDKMTDRFGEEIWYKLLIAGIIEAILGALIIIVVCMDIFPGTAFDLTGLLALAGIMLASAGGVYLPQIAQEKGCTVPVKAVLTSIRKED